MGAIRRWAERAGSVVAGAVVLGSTVITAPAVAATTSVVDYGASGYRYLQVPVGGGPADFADPAFDDSAFLPGTAPFGEATGNCPLDPATFWSKLSDLLVRRTVPLPAGTTDVTVHVAVDNDFTLFWNGSPVGSGVNEGCAAHDTFVIDVPDSLLTGGPNVLAVRATDRDIESLLDLRVTADLPPVCDTVELSPTMLWPPDHAFHAVTAHGGYDGEGGEVTLAITGVTQDEALDGTADGHTSPDASRTGMADDQVLLRAERSGRGDGRVYRVEVTATTSDGQQCTTTAVVGVPHDLGAGRQPVDTTGVVVDSFGPPPSQPAGTTATPPPASPAPVAPAPSPPATAPATVVPGQSRSDSRPHPGR